MRWVGKENDGIKYNINVYNTVFSAGRAKINIRGKQWKQHRILQLVQLLVARACVYYNVWSVTWVRPSPRSLLLQLSVRHFIILIQQCVPP